jgi:hypothetical protein
MNNPFQTRDSTDLYLQKGQPGRRRMRWVESILDELSDPTHLGYQTGTPSSTEPAALAALALAGYGRHEAAEKICRWLASIQSGDGTLGISAAETSPHWPTGLAVIAWNALRHAPDASNVLEAAIGKAMGWILTMKGETSPRNDEVGHDTMAIGWPWVAGTHAWVEPTVFNLLALKARGHAQHLRARQAVGLLVDRLLPGGGCNYGNTVVLGQTLRAHVEPTGLTLTALADEPDTTGRVARSITYLESALDGTTTAASLAYGLIGLAAFARTPVAAAQWLASAAERTRRRGASPYRLALLALASLGTECPLLQGAQRQ